MLLPSLGALVSRILEPNKKKKKKKKSEYGGRESKWGVRVEYKGIKKRSILQLQAKIQGWNDELQLFVT